MAKYGVPAEADGHFRSLERLPWQREWGARVEPGVQLETVGESE